MCTWGYRLFVLSVVIVTALLGANSSNAAPREVTAEDVLALLKKGELQTALGRIHNASNWSQSFWDSVPTLLKDARLSDAILSELRKKPYLPIPVLDTMESLREKGALVPQLVQKIDVILDLTLSRPGKDNSARESHLHAVAICLRTTNNPNLQAKAVTVLEKTDFWTSEMWREIPALLKSRATQFKVSQALASRSQWAPSFWIEVRNLLRDRDLRYTIREGLLNQREWPPGIWSDLTQMLGEKDHQAFASKLIQDSRKEWQESVWRGLPTLLLRPDTFPIVDDLVQKQETWPKQFWEDFSKLIKDGKTNSRHFDLLLHSPDWDEEIWNALPTGVQSSTDAISALEKRDIPEQFRERLLSALTEEAKKQSERRRPALRILGKYHQSAFELTSQKACEIVCGQIFEMSKSNGLRQYMSWSQDVPLTLLKLLFDLKADEVCWQKLGLRKKTMDAFFPTRDACDMDRVPEFLDIARAANAIQSAWAEEPYKGSYAAQFYLEILNEFDSDREPKLTAQQKRAFERSRRTIIHETDLQASSYLQRKAKFSLKKVGSTLTSYNIPLVINALRGLHTSSNQSPPELLSPSLFSTAIIEGLKKDQKGEIYFGYHWLDPIEPRSESARQGAAPRTVTALTMYLLHADQNNAEIEKTRRALFLSLKRMTKDRLSLVDNMLFNKQYHDSNDGKTGAHYLYPNLPYALQGIEYLLAHHPSTADEAALREMKSSLLEVLISLNQGDTRQFQSYSGFPLSHSDDGKLANNILAGMALLPYAKDCRPPAKP